MNAMVDLTAHFPIQATNDLDKKDRLAMMLQLGLNHQIDQCVDVKENRLDLARKNFIELSTYEIYLFKSIFANNEQPITEYTKERMPDHAIKNLFLSNGMNCFERVELWQLIEENKKDPMLVGIIEPHAFVLGVWGEPRIDIEAMERKLLGNMYEVKDRIKAIIDRSPVNSLTNKFKIQWMSPDRYGTNAAHCPDEANLSKQRVKFKEFNYINDVKFYELALCPNCKKIVDIQPTVVE